MDKAIEVYNKCINLNSNYVEAYNNTGNAYRDQGKLDNAIKAYNKALLINPNFAEANKNLSFSLLSTGILRKVSINMNGDGKLKICYLS